MKTLKLICCALFALAIFETCTSSSKKKLSNQEKVDSIKNDELQHSIDHGYLRLAQRPLIRPIYVGTEKNLRAEQSGFQFTAVVKNAATIVSYTNIILEIEYFDSKGKQLNNERIKVERTIHPGDTAVVNKKVLKYKNTAYRVKIAEASVVK